MERLKNVAVMIGGLFAFVVLCGVCFSVMWRLMPAYDISVMAGTKPFIVTSNDPGKLDQNFQRIYQDIPDGFAQCVGITFYGDAAVDPDTATATFPESFSDSTFFFGIQTVNGPYTYGAYALYGEALSNRSVMCYAVNVATGDSLWAKVIGIEP